MTEQKMTTLKSESQLDHELICRLMKEHQVRQEDFPLCKAMLNKLHLAKAILNEYIGIGYYADGNQEKVLQLVHTLTTTEQNIILNRLVNMLGTRLGGNTNAQ